MGECGAAAGSAGGGAPVEDTLWWVGVLLSVVSSVLSNLGVNTQKMSLMREAKRVSKPRAYFQQPLWFLGLMLVFVGSLGDFAALGFAAQTLVTPVGAVTMVANLFFASLWLGETLSAKDIGGTVLILLGAVLAAAFADKTEQCFTLDQLIEMYSRPSFVAYAVCATLLMTSFYWLSRRCEAVKAQHGADSKPYARLRKLHPFCYALLSGTAGAQSILFAKSTAELLAISFDGEVPFTRPVAWLIIGMMLASIFMQLHWMARGLEQFDALYIVPVFQCFFITVAILGGGVYFDELSRFTLLQAVMFSAGVLLTVIGVGILSTHKMSDATAAATSSTQETVQQKAAVSSQDTPAAMPPASPASYPSLGLSDVHEGEILSGVSVFSGSSAGAGAGGARPHHPADPHHTHVSQLLGLRPSLALSVTSLSAELKAALKAAGAKADREEAAEAAAAAAVSGAATCLVASASTAGSGGGGEGGRVRTNQVAPFPSTSLPGAPPAGFTGGSGSGGSSGGMLSSPGAAPPGAAGAGAYSFMAATLSLHTLSDSIKAALKAAGEKADREEAAAAAAAARGDGGGSVAPMAAWEETP